MDWIKRLERLNRKHRRLVIRRNVQAYRKRQEQAGIRRVDLALSAEQYATVIAEMKPGESIRTTFGRILESISGNTRSETNNQ